MTQIKSNSGSRRNSKTKSAGTADGPKALHWFAAGATVLAAALAWTGLDAVERSWIPPDTSEAQLHLNHELDRLDLALLSLDDITRQAQEDEPKARFLAGFDHTERHIHAESVYPEIPKATELGPRLLTYHIKVDQTLAVTNHLLESYGQVLEEWSAHAEIWASIPSIPPVHGARLTSHFGRRRDPFTGHRARHAGVDLAAPYGSAVRASAAGTVREARWVGGYGRYIELDHGNGIRTRYAHNSRLLVTAGEHVQRGQVIARLGSSGRANAPHLHYEVLVDGIPMNPSRGAWVGHLAE